MTTTEVLEYDEALRAGVGNFLTIAYAQVRIINVTTGCAAPNVPSRKLLAINNTAYNITVNGTAILVNTSSVLLSLTDVQASIISGGLLAQLYNVTTSASARTALRSALNAALATAGSPPAVISIGTVGAQVLPPPLLPPPPFPPPLPPGVTPATALKAGNEIKRAARSGRSATEVGKGIAYALAAIVVLWFPVHAIIHAATVAHARRTAVSVAVALRCKPVQGTDEMIYRIHLPSLELYYVTRSLHPIRPTRSDLPRWRHLGRLPT